MRKTVISILVLAGIMLPFMVQAKNQQLNEKVQVSADKPIMVKRNNPVVTIQLAANPSTGYRWILTSYSSKLVSPINAKFYLPKDAKPGQGGTTVWQFRLKPEAFIVPQVFRVELIYARPWELKPQRQETLTIVTE